MEVRDGLRYTQEHEWLRLEGDADDEGVIGITDFAQNELGDVVYLDLPKVGSEVARGAHLGDIESVKTVSELFAPASGTVLAVNELLNDDPALVNSAPYEDGWMVRLRLSDPGELDALLDADAYRSELPAD